MAFSKDKTIYCTQGPEQLAPMGLGKLTGLSFVFKDLFDVKGYATGAGNPAWLTSHSVALATSPLIQRLLAQGAECVGRVQTDELAYSLNGQNCHYGTPMNPLAPESIPGGSSSGSAVAVAKKDADFSIGTDTGGSIRVPSSYCGLFGIRPTLGALSLDHCFELSQSFDTAGVMARSLSVLERVFDQLKPEYQPVEFDGEAILEQAFMPYLDAQRKARVDTAFKYAKIEYSITDTLDNSVWNLEELSELFRTIQGYEIIQKHDIWLAEHGSTLDDAIQQRVSWSRTITRSQYQLALNKQQEFSRFVSTELLGDNNRILLLPTTPGAPPALDMDATRFASYRSELMGLTAIAGLCGLPQLHIPMSKLTYGPAGISLLGPANSEATLFALAKRLLNSGAQL
jgi:aspartyl-tRNA(Asn)/glutamyl-tRNA(Gln) amidotransferase subunit A